MKRISAVSLVLVYAVLLAAGCAGTTPATALPATKSAATVAGPTSARAATWQADGVISAGEYPHQASFGSIDVSWRNDTQFLYIAIQAKTTGWLAVAVSPQGTMMGSNYLIGVVSGDKTQIEDQFGNSSRSHVLDTSLGGTSDIIASGGSLQGGVTTWEAQIPLDSGDQYDIALKPGQTVTIILAYGSSASQDSPHVFRTSGQINLD
ncbi:MAG: DOMON domain-containing protein [Anaerolineae bacterium]